MKNLEANIIVVLIITATFYLLGSLCAWNINPAGWHWVLRTIIGIFWLASIIKSLKS